jgi:hypothetical protein
MSQITGGDITEVTYSNEDVGAGRFFAIAGEDSTFDLGGYVNDDGGAIDGAGRFIHQKNLTPWSFSVLCSNNMGETDEFEAARDLQRSTKPTTFTFSLANGISYSGVGSLVGSVELNGNKSTWTLNVKGGGRLQQL